MKLPNLTQIIQGVVIFIAAGSFIISYNNLHESALMMGIPPLLAIVFPLTIDMFLLAATLAILYAGQKCGDRASSLVTEGWFFLIVYTVASIAFNIHMAPDDWWSRAGFAMCPVGLCIALHFLMRILEIEMGGCPAPAAPPEEEESPIPVCESEVTQEPEPVPCESAVTLEEPEPIPEMTENRQKVYEVFMNQPESSIAEACRQTGLSFKTVKAHYTALKEMGMLS